VGGTPTSYTYDGDGVCIRKTQGMATTTSLWDRASGLPLLVDDGTHGYLPAGGCRRSSMRPAPPPIS
jgi:hypothetical protein